MDRSYHRSLYNSNLALIYSLEYLYECRDELEGSHLKRIGEFSELLAKSLAKNRKYADYIDAEYLETIKVSSRLHDIGKLGVSENILFKKGKLTSEEFDKVKKHTILGADKIQKIMNEFPGNPWLNMSKCIIRSHHEHYNGAGYPDGLMGEEIPLSARITAVADVYDALRSKRPYKEPYSHEKSVKIIQAGKETHFDPDVVNSFLSSESEFKTLYAIVSGL